MLAKERILVALDTTDIGKLNEYARTLGPYVGGFKIGLEALLSIGLKPALNAIKGYSAASENIFVDAKIHDIPNTMAGAVRAVCEFPQVKFVNVHASAGAEGMRAAVEAAAEVAAARGPQATRAKVLAVTVLTSMSPKDAADVYCAGHPGPMADGSANVTAIVLGFARTAREAGCDGVVCSPHEAKFVRNMSAGRLVTVTPGVRPKWSAKNDQERVTTPADAVKAGADYLVIGRPITSPPEKIGTPAAAAKLIAEEIAEALR